MTASTIVNICLQNLLKKDARHCYDAETANLFFESTYDEVIARHPHKKLAGLSWIIAGRIEELLIADC